MTSPAKPEAVREPQSVDPYPDYRPIYGWVFQAWLILFLGVICAALAFYLLPYLKTAWEWVMTQF